MRAGTTPNGQPRSTALYEAILRLDNLDDCIRFFEDLCAVTELRTMEQGACCKARCTAKSAS